MDSLLDKEERKTTRHRQNLRKVVQRFPARGMRVRVSHEKLVAQLHVIYSITAKRLNVEIAICVNCIHHKQNIYGSRVCAAPEHMEMRIDYIVGVWRPLIAVNDNMPSCYDKNENGDCALFSPGEQKVVVLVDGNGKPIRGDKI